MSKARLSSVQQQYIRAREVRGDVLSLFAPQSVTRRSYCAVLDISPVNFVLKAAEEQEALLHRYAALLKALTFPVQILIRNQPMDLRPYLAQIREQAKQVAEPKASSEEGNGLWSELAADLEHLVSHLGSRRTLLHRQCYLIIPAPESFGPSHTQTGWRKKRRAARAETFRQRVLAELAVRVEMIEGQLQALGLPTRRLHGPELARLYQSCLTPERALNHPLNDSHVCAVGRLPQVPDVALQVQKEGVSAPHAIIGQSDEPAGMKEGFALDTTLKTGVGWRWWRWSRNQEPKASRRNKRKQQSLAPADTLPLADLLAPGSIQEFHDAIRLDGDREEWVRGITVTAFPREVSTSGWLAPLLLHDDILDVIFHLHPQDSVRMLRQLKRQRTGYASTRAFNRRYGRLDEPEMDVAQTDVLRMMGKLASGEERLFEVSMLLLVRAPDRQTLGERSERIMALLQTVLLDAVAHPTTFEHRQALCSALPECHDALRRTITLDTTSLSTTFPFISNTLSQPGGVLLGITENGELVLLDPWHPSFGNPHVFIGGRTGTGKSFFGKQWIERTLLVHGMHGERILVIDPDGEYIKQAHALNGSVISIAAGSAQHLNPFDLVPPGCELDQYLEASKNHNRLAEKIRDLRSLLGIMVAEKGTELSSRERALLDSALYETYRRVGISNDPRTHYHTPPLLRDLSDVLRSGVCGKDEFDLVLRLSPYVEGSHAGLFSDQTNVPLDSHLLVWDIREMKDELLPIGMFLIADCIWTQAIYQSHIRRALYIDEAATLLEHTEGGRFLSNLSRRARKRYLRLVVMTQNPERFAEDEYGSIVAANAAIKILKRQDSTSIKAVASSFGLTHGEAERLLTLSADEALMLAGDRRVLLTSPASPREYSLMTTNPVELAQQSMKKGDVHA